MPPTILTSEPLPTDTESLPELASIVKWLPLIAIESLPALASIVMESPLLLLIMSSPQPAFIDTFEE